MMFIVIQQFCVHRHWESYPQSFSRSVKDLVELQPEVCRAAFVFAGIDILEERTMPQQGIAALRAVSYLAGKILAVAGKRLYAQTAGSESGTIVVSGGRSSRQRVMPLFWLMVLQLNYPFDHWLKFPLHPAPWRT